MNTAPDLTMSTTIATTDQTEAAAAPRIKLLSHGFSIDHPDPEIGEQLMANALGVADREAMHGILRQLVKASVSGESPDEVNLSFMISMVHQAPGCRRGHAGGADGFGSCDGDAMCPSPCECGRSRSARQRRARIGQARPHVSRPDRGAQPLSEPRRACHHRAERVGRGWRQGHCRQRHAACALDRIGQEPGIRGAECAEGRGLQAKARFR
jgi:hypothetical protein